MALSTAATVRRGHSGWAQYVRDSRTLRSALDSAAAFFPAWPRRHDENTERIAMQRRWPIDDQWVNPHNPCLAMFANASVHVLPFATSSDTLARAVLAAADEVCATCVHTLWVIEDPRFGCDHARQYAAKYASSGVAACVHVERAS